VSRSVALTPSPSCSKPTSSVANRTSAVGCDRRWASSTGSRWSWGTAASIAGLTAATCRRLGKPLGNMTPSGEARVSVAQAPASTMATSPARTCSSSPKERSSSMVRTLTPVARGRGDRPGLRSTSSDPTP
jgi:hypothetical protein